MKILLVQPAKPEKALGGEDFAIYEPLALEYLAAGVSGDHDVRIIDMRIDHDIASHLHEYRPNVVGITSYTVHVNTVKKLFQQIKALNPDIVTVVGGHHATIVPSDFYTSYIDVIITGEGVFPFREVIARLENKMDLSDIPGAVTEGNSAVVINQKDQNTDLDALPFPRRDLNAAQ